MPNAYPDSLRQAVLDRYLAGASAKTVAEEFGISTQVIRVWRRQAGISRLLSPPLPDDLFLPAWEKSGHKINKCAKLLKIGAERARREADRRKLIRVKVDVCLVAPDVTLCTACGGIVSNDDHWAQACEDDPHLHHLCREVQNGNAIMYDPDRQPSPPLQ